MSAVETLIGYVRGAGRGGVLVLFILAVAGCDFDVSNPGPVQDDNLEAQAAHGPMVQGAVRATLNGKSMLDLQGGAIVRDFQAASHTGWAGVQPRIEAGELTENWLDTYEGWDRTHSGRWIAEHTVQRIQESENVDDPGSYQPLARAYLWAGFANRVLGEYMCNAVIDGGPAEPYTLHFERAIGHFENAEQVAAAAGASDIEMAAIAGKAQSHMNLGNWNEAVSAANQVPMDFEYEVSYPVPTGTSEYDWVIEAATRSFKAVTMWNTAIEDHFNETGDSRVAWGNDPNTETDIPRPTYNRQIPLYYPLALYAPVQPGALETFSPVEEQQRVIPQDDVANGREMVLIRAEAALVNGNWQDAMTLINQVRTTAHNDRWDKTGNWHTGEPLAPVEASNLTEAWEALKFERLIELNLDGRRFGDRKRWRVNQSPGMLHPDEYIPAEMAQKYGTNREPDICFPIPDTEKDANENIDASFQSPEIPRLGVF